jgi:hypothetical protein
MNNTARKSGERSESYLHIKAHPRGICFFSQKHLIFEGVKIYLQKRGIE